MRALILCALFSSSFFLASSCSYLHLNDEKMSEETVPAPENIVEQAAKPTAEKPATLVRPSGEIAAGDLWHISMIGEEELEGYHVAIAPDGRLYYAFLEGIPAEGKKVAEVKREVEKALTRYFVDPQVAIIPIRSLGEAKQDAPFGEAAISKATASHMIYSEGQPPFAIEVSSFPSDAEIAQMIFEQTKQTITDQSPSSSGLYRLAPENQIELAVYGEPTTRRQVAIGQTGDISFLSLASIRAQGKTIPQLREEIQEQLKNYYQDPIVLVTFVSR